MTIARRRLAVVGIAVLPLIGALVMVPIRRDQMRASLPGEVNGIREAFNRGDCQFILSNASALFRKAVGTNWDGGFNFQSNCESLRSILGNGRFLSRKTGCGTARRCRWKARPNLRTACVG